MNEDLLLRIEDLERENAMLRALIRPEDWKQCAGRRYADGERCQRPAELDEPYCKRHLAMKRIGAQRRARHQQKREAAGWW